MTNVNRDKLNIETVEAPPKTPVDTHAGTRAALTASFFMCMVMAFGCLAGAAFYMYNFQARLGEISGAITPNKSSLDLNYPSLAEQEVKAISIAYVKRIELLSTGVFVGLAFGFLGFALLVIGVRGDISAEGSQGPFTVKFSHLSPGVLVLIAATILTGVCTTRSLPLDMRSNSGSQTPQPSPTPTGNTESGQHDQRKTQKSPAKQGNASFDQSADRWKETNAAADEGFRLLGEEADAQSSTDKRKLWTQRTAAFRRAEVIFRQWAFGEGQKYVQAGGASELKMLFRDALYSEYAGDYEEAAKLFSECQRNTNLQDSSATWNRSQIASLVVTHQQYVDIAWNHYLHLEQQNQQTQNSLNGLGSRLSPLTTFRNESFSGGMAYSTEDAAAKNEAAYKKIHDLEVQAAEWDDLSWNGAAIKKRAKGADLRNDPSLPQ